MKKLDSKQFCSLFVGSERHEDQHTPGVNKPTALQDGAGYMSSSPSQRERVADLVVPVRSFRFRRADAPEAVFVLFS